MSEDGVFLLCLVGVAAYIFVSFMKLVLGDDED